MEIIFRDYEETFAPPKSPVLRVQLVGDQLFFSISEVDETYDEVKYTNIAEMSVNSVEFTLGMVAIFEEAAQKAEKGA